ncbi:Hypothetical_protein [Hexamita inflata]|uniref:Hypothetical_protein n=1 Tax=Hexamita inflata TaxID=28002 RepID=A0AA86PY23_9EUKA|nr:Hypothetical protein HINF_LOCUS34586 [Hexamita inflata]
MPYIIKSEENRYLVIQWTNNKYQSYNKSSLQESYDFIYINGSYYSQFEDFEILRKSTRISISNCKIDLSLLNRSFDNLSLHKCICDKNISNLLQVTDLQINGSMCKVSQLQELTQCCMFIDINSIHQNEFDYWNCDQLQCQLIHLCINNYQINVSNLAGNWQLVSLYQCQLSSSGINTKFSTKQLEVTFDEQTDLSCLNQIECEEIGIYAAAKDFNYKYDLSLQLKSKLSYSTIDNFVCDVTNFADCFTELELVNCKFIGVFNSHLSKLQTLNIIISDETKLDLHSLFEIKLPFLKIFIQDIAVKQLDLLLCKPNILQFTGCSLNLKVLEGQWSQIVIDKCLIDNADCQISADKVQIIESGSNFHCFKANQMTCAKFNQSRPFQVRFVFKSQNRQQISFKRTKPFKNCKL